MENPKHFDKPVLEKICKLLKGKQRMEKEKRLKRHSSLFLRKFLDEEIERNELLIQKCDSFPIENREVLQYELTRRIDCYKQLECIVHEWTQLKTKPADYDNTQ